VLATKKIAATSTPHSTKLVISLARNELNVALLDDIAAAPKGWQFSSGDHTFPRKKKPCSFWQPAKPGIHL
jgi:hypothetical protein